MGPRLKIQPSFQGSNKIHVGNLLKHCPAFWYQKFITKLCISCAWLHFHSLLAWPLLRASLLATWECLGRFLCLFVRITAWSVARTQKDKKSNEDTKGNCTKHDGPPILLNCFFEAWWWKKCTFKQFLWGYETVTHKLLPYYKLAPYYKWTLPPLISKILRKLHPILPGFWYSNGTHWCIPRNGIMISCTISSQ